MFKVIEKENDLVTVKMDIDTYNGLEEEMNEDFSSYECVFEEPVNASDLLIK